MFETESISDLVMAAQKEDLAAEHRLFSRLSARLFNLTKCILVKRYSKTHVSVIEHDARDIVQLVLITIQSKYKEIQFDAEKGFFAWSNRILRNKIGNYMNKKARTEETFEVLRQPDYLTHKHNANVAEQAEYQELLENIKGCVKRLDRICKKVMRVFLEHGTRQDIVDIFPNTPMGTIDNKIFRCRGKLKKILLREGYIS